jgi:hypothetical protein
VEERRKVTVKKRGKTVTVTKSFTSLVDEDFTWKDPKAAEKAGMRMMKAATNRSYHGGSFRGGYGHGLAADVVSVEGGTRDQRWTSSEKLWKWIDAHGKEFGIGRPYLDKDPAHVAPIDGTEYAAHHRDTTAHHAGSDMKKHTQLAVRNNHSVAKRPRTARSSRTI